MEKIVKNLNTLKAMERKNLIKLHKDTSKGFYYIDDAINYFFNYKNNKYKIKFFDGCFCPFVIQLTFNK